MGAQKIPAVDTVNQPVDPADYVYIVHLAGWGFEANYPVELRRDELERYNRDPDLFAAKHYGFETADEYREWVESQGYARCSERTKSGRFCKVTIGGPSLSAVDWRERHRSHACPVHSKAEARS